MKTTVWALALLACRGPDTDVGSPPESIVDTGSIPPFEVTSAEPLVIDPIGGSRLVVRGLGLSGVDSVTIGSDSAVVQIVSDTELWIVTPPTSAGPVSLELRRGELSGSLELDAWSPADLDGVRFFDASVGVHTAEADTAYEWQRLTPEISPDWRVRDGNTLNWLPSTGRYVMVAGWNGFEVPDGFADDPYVYPPQNTTTEVWSSADGVEWRLDVPHGSDQFERRHAHNTVLWNDALWMIGGDTHQGYYNHDVVSSADGVTWTEVLAPGTPPWEPRALQVTGVYDGLLWTGGGQSLLDDPAEYVYHNDLWSSPDGEHWTQVAADGPESETRWRGCGIVDGFVEFHGEMWLVGCARYRDDGAGHTMYNEVWSTTDGVTWQQHAEPPWVGKIWHNVVVWDDKLWAMFGFTYGDPENGWPLSNSNEVWWSDDGESWHHLPIDSPEPGSHAQGLAVREDSLLYAGGNYSFGFGAGVDKSAWRMVPWRGERVDSWTDRGAGLVASATGDARPLVVEDGFGAGIAGVQFDGSANVLAMSEFDGQEGGRSVFVVARTPYVPRPWGWEEYAAPVGTIVGGTSPDGYPQSSIGVSDGQIVMINREAGAGTYGEPLWTRNAAGSGLQEGPGAIRMFGLTHAADDTVQMWVDGEPAGDPMQAGYQGSRGWQQIGGGLEGSYYGPNSRFAGTIGAVIVAPGVLSADEIQRIEEWSKGRFPRD